MIPNIQNIKIRNPSILIKYLFEWFYNAQNQKLILQILNHLNSSNMYSLKYYVYPNLI